MNRINKFTTQDKNNLLSKTFYALPDNPSDKQFSASQIKKKGYEGYLVLMDFINEVIDALNANVDLSNEQVTTINNAISELQSYFSSGKALRAISDEEGANIRDSYMSSSWGLYAQELTNKMTLGLQLKKGDGTVMDRQWDITGASIFKAGLLLPADKYKIDKIASDIADALAEAKAYALLQDMNKVSKVNDLNVVYVNNGSTPSAIPYSINPMPNVFPLRDADGDILVPISPSSYYGATSQKYVEDRIYSATKRTALVSKLGEASTSLNGLMSAQDKLNLDTLMTLLGSESGDVDSFVNTIREVLAIFNQYPEGQSLVNALALKFDKADVVDALNSSETAKALSANQGKVLKELVDTKANASDVYDKTYIDNAIDGFVFADIDEELDAESEDAIMNKAVVAGLETKANKDGNYPTMTVGQAEAIASNREIEDAEIACPPITFGIAGDEAEIQTGINNLEYLEGKSIKFNQLVFNGNFSSSSPTYWIAQNASLSINDNIGTFTETSSSNTLRTTINVTNTIGSKMMSGHKYLAKLLLKHNATSNKSISFSSSGVTFSWGSLTPNEWHSLERMFTATSNSDYVDFAIFSATGTADKSVQLQKVQLFDLTAMGLEDITIDEFNKMFPLDYYEKNTGTILSTKSYQLISRGKNQFSALNEFIPVIGGEEYEISGISAGGVLYQYDASKNLIATSDTFTDTVDIEMEENTAFVKISATTYEDIMFYLTFPEDGGVYGEPYVAPRVETINLPNIELRSVGDVKDIAYASGGGKRRVGIVDLGTLDWNGPTGNNLFYVKIGDIKKPTNTDERIKGLLSSLYIANPSHTATGTIENLEMVKYDTQFIYLRNDSYSDASTFKASLSGVYLLYELATETDIPLSENAGWTPEIFVDNFGTLEFVTNPAQVPQVEQPYFVRYTVSLVEFIDTAYVKTKGDGNNIATQEEVDAMKTGNVEVGLARVAENISPYSENSGAEDTSAFTFQTAGGDADIGATAELRALRGKTIKWNQLLKDFSTNNYWSITTGTFVNNNGEGTFTLTGDAQYNSGLAVYATTKIGHKYLLLATLKTSVDNANISFRQDDNYSYLHSTTSYKTYSWIHTATGKSRMFCIQLNSGVSGDTMTVKNCMCIDLTEIFGAGNEPTSVAEFNRIFPKPYYEYNAGELLSAKSNGYKTVGFNAFDGELELGYLSAVGTYNGSNTDILSKNFLKVIPSTKYSIEANNFTHTSVFVCEYDENQDFISGTRQNISTTHEVTVTENTHYIKFWFYNGGTAMSDVPADPQICVHLTWDNERDGEYEEHVSETYPLPNVELRSAGSAYDELRPGGTLIRRIGSYTFTGNETWTYSASRYWRITPSNLPSSFTPKANTGNTSVSNLLIVEFISSSFNVVYGQSQNKTIGYTTEDGLFLYDSSLASKTASEMASYMSGKTIYFELATPTEEQTSNTFQEVTDIDDFGTQEFLSEQEIQVPQGAEFFYPVDYKAFIDTMYNKVEGDADEFVTQEELQTALSTFLSSITGYDASKNQTLKHDDTGEMAWVDDEEE